MAALQEALKCLNATPWDSIPTDQASLRSYITDLRTKARLIIDSVPNPPSSSSTSPTTTSSSGKTRIKPSSARHKTTDETTLSLQKEWSKPIVKPSVSKENPLGIPVYKLPGADGQGHWFGRRSVHEGLPYSIWKTKLSGEIAETLRKNQERVKDGLAPDHAVRGIGAQQRLEELEIFDESGEKVIGRLNIYHVSASFPRPTTSRDFVAMIITWEGEDANPGELDGEKEGRSWMMVSRPVEHEGAPEGQEYIRGQYESVEMIREILVKNASSSASGSGSGSGTGSGSTDTDDLEESNPVEWIMVTRSDPGGTIPRWMVEKGTPKSICGDAAKFLDWAVQGTQPATKGRDRGRSSLESKTSSIESKTQPADVQESESSESDLSEYEPEEHHGLIASVGHLLNFGLERYAPQAVLDYIPQHSRQSSRSGQRPHFQEPSEETIKSTPEKPSTPQKTTKEEDECKDETLSQISLNSDLPTEPTTPGDINLDVTAAEILQRTRKGKLSSHERQLAKLAQQKRSVEAQIDLIRSDIHSLGLRPPDEREKPTARASLENYNSSASQPGSAANSIKLTADDRTSSSSNMRARADTPTTSDNPEISKVAQALFRDEAKLVRRLAKIERHQLKEAAKIEAQNRKDAEKQDKARSKDETEALRKEVERLKKECEKLKSERKQWLSLIGTLQGENTRLARQVGNGGNGEVGAAAAATGSK
ncbi:hypothetical protein BJY04DRAFT_62734 [Aspergillus karnatakaensis]|uniref:uncharacterized protein n=1 Tax=Aspergillus karnatakaensis TaxID=1810916 RepID=UPI003CCCFD88